MTFHVERKARVREAYDALSKPAKYALLLFLDRKMKPSVVARRMGLTTGEARELIGHALGALANAA